MYRVITHGDLCDKTALYYGRINKGVDEVCSKSLLCYLCYYLQNYLNQSEFLLYNKGNIVFAV